MTTEPLPRRPKLAAAKDAILRLLADGPMEAKELSSSLTSAGHSDTMIEKARSGLRRAGAIKSWRAKRTAFYELGSSASEVA